ncbi:MAG: hypothetical protein AAGI45_23200 [Cyanobacteria bacterium P01_H01_bin.26]
MKKNDLHEFLSDHDLSTVAAELSKLANERFRHPAVTDSLGRETAIQLERLSHDLEQIEHLHASLLEIAPEQKVSFG